MWVHKSSGMYNCIPTQTYITYQLPQPSKVPSHAHCLGMDLFLPPGRRETLWLTPTRDLDDDYIIFLEFEYLVFFYEVLLLLEGGSSTIWITCSFDLEELRASELLLLPILSWWCCRARLFPWLVRSGPSPTGWPIFSAGMTGHLQRGHVALLRSQRRMQSPWNTCLHNGNCLSSSFNSNSPKQTQHSESLALNSSSNRITWSLSFSSPLIPKLHGGERKETEWRADCCNLGGCADILLLALLLR